MVADNSPNRWEQRSGAVKDIMSSSESSDISSLSRSDERSVSDCSEDPLPSESKSSYLSSAAE